MTSSQIKFNNVFNALRSCFISLCVGIVVLSLVLFALLLPSYDRFVYALHGSEIKGHLMPIGSHRPPNPSIDVLEEFPHPVDFFERYVNGSKPVLFKGLAKKMPAFRLWNDAYLREKFGDFDVTVETGKKEDRSNPMLHLKLKDFLERYSKEDIYMVHDLMSLQVANKAMLADMIVPRCLQCGNFQKVLNNVIMWFSSGGTNSVLHTDSLDNINCILSGSKQFFMIDKKHGIHETFDKAGSHSGVNVEKVDMLKYPELQDVPWYNVTMETGDCLFIPYLWGHNVKSSNSRNMAVNYWMTHLGYFNKSECQDYQPKDDIPLSKLESGEPPYLFVQNILSTIDEVGNLSFQKFFDLMKVLMEIDEISVKLNEDLKQVFVVLDLDADGVLVKDEVIQCDSSLLKPFVSSEMIDTGYSKDEL